MFHRRRKFSVPPTGLSRLLVSSLMTPVVTFLTVVMQPSRLNDEIHYGSDPVSPPKPNADVQMPRQSPARNFPKKIYPGHVPQAFDDNSQSRKEHTQWSVLPPPAARRSIRIRYGVVRSGNLETSYPAYNLHDSYPPAREPVNLP